MDVAAVALIGFLLVLGLAYLRDQRKREAVSAYFHFRAGAATARYLESESPPEAVVRRFWDNVETQVGREIPRELEWELDLELEIWERLQDTDESARVYSGIVNAAAEGAVSLMHEFDPADATYVERSLKRLREKAERRAAENR